MSDDSERAGRQGRQSSKPIAALADERRAKILQAAFHVIGRRGVDHARLVDVADEAEVSVGMIQHYFRSRNTLIAETFRWKLDESLASYEAEVEGSNTAWEAVEALCRVLTREPFNEINSLWLEFFSICNRDPEFAALGSDLWDRWVGRVRSVIQQGIDDGEFRPQAPAEDIAARFVSLADGLGIRVLVHHSSMSIHRMYQLLLEGTSQELGVKLAKAVPVRASG